MSQRRFVPSLLAVTSITLVAVNPALGETPKDPVKNSTVTAAKLVPKPVPKPEPAALKPFEDVIKGAKVTKGLFPLWQKEDKVWLEVAPGQLDKNYFFSYNTVQGIGERWLYGGLMGQSHVVYFHRIGDNLQLLARNTSFMAQEGDPIQRVVGESFSDSLISHAMVASQPHPDRKTFLVDASSLLLRDIPMGGLRLEQVYRQPYGFDASNSSFTSLGGTPEWTGIQVNAHFALAKLMLPPMPLPGAQPVPMAPLPGTLEDLRSLFMGYYYNFSQLPEKPMAPRMADDRVGHFVTTRWDWTSDLLPDPRTRLVNRWRLEKADPEAPLSKPREPIVYWLDRNIPARYRDTVKAGILEWNKAFERIGIQDAIEVRQQPDDAEWSTHDSRHASVRWLLGVDAAFSIGPSVVDPRSGEILDADIGISGMLNRLERREFSEEVPTTAGLLDLDPSRACTYLAGSAQEAGFALDLLEARGDLEPGSGEEDAFVLAHLKAVVMHEVGHTLGLRHNFRASTIYTQEQISDKAFTATHGLAGSVMDYIPASIAPKGARQGDFHMPTLGPYDYWAIEFAYKPLEAASEKEELAKIASRGERDPLLAYGSDEEAGGFLGAQGMDPEVNRFDLGRDPLQYLGTRIQLSRELLGRLQDKPVRSGDDYLKLRRGVNLAFHRIEAASENAAKYLGGVIYVRDHAGSGREPFTPVSAARQREALGVLKNGVFDLNAFRFKPEFMTRLTVNQFDRFNKGGIAPDFSLSTLILRIQKVQLELVLNPPVMRRILDTPDKLADPRTAFRLSELFDGLQGAIWAEVKAGKEPASVRRALQKEHLRALAELVLHPSADTPEDARALAREGLRTLGVQLKTAMLKPGFSKETRAHFAECSATIEEVLKAPLQRHSL